MEDDWRPFEFLVSFLAPIRDDPERTLLGLQSIKETASDTIDYEILIRFDDDDPTYLDLIPKITEMFEGTRGEVKIVIGPRYGYAGLEHYYNELANLSRGKLLFLWNSDLQILRVKQGWDVSGEGHDFPIYECWDEILKQDEANREPHIFLLTPTEVYWDLPESGEGVKYAKQISTMAFPILTREGYEVMGHFSKSPLNDAYLLDVATLKIEGKRTKKRSRVMLLHSPEVDETGEGVITKTDSYKEARRIHYSDTTREHYLEDQEKLMTRWRQKNY